jgi:hypothetical protein
MAGRRLSWVVVVPVAIAPPAAPGVLVPPRAPHLEHEHANNETADDDSREHSQSTVTSGRVTFNVR